MEDVYFTNAAPGGAVNSPTFEPLFSQAKQESSFLWLFVTFCRDNAPAPNSKPVFLGPQKPPTLSILPMRNQNTNQINKSLSLLGRISLQSLVRTGGVNLL
jgi:hypothetical protein